jgi:hypothetical protein
MRPRLGIARCARGRARSTIETVCSSVDSTGRRIACFFLNYSERISNKSYCMDSAIWIFAHLKKKTNLICLESVKNDMFWYRTKQTLHGHHLVPIKPWTNCFRHSYIIKHQQCIPMMIELALWWTRCSDTKMMKIVWPDLSRRISWFSGSDRSPNHVSETRDLKIGEHQSCEQLDDERWTSHWINMPKLDNHHTRWS